MRERTCQRLLPRYDALMPADRETVAIRRERRIQVKSRCGKILEQFWRRKKVSRTEKRIFQHVENPRLKGARVRNRIPLGLIKTPRRNDRIEIQRSPHPCMQCAQAKFDKGSERF